ncbi:KGGVGR-motif variant AAA ATPase [Kitasatospora sp. NPDC058046]|uniref:KGGVGR-motif variant AAA ATPase n=1 Tax=Kitasatospora sp. NPDC058046 TaxID=3346312 RepID=UPI0036D9951E
MDSGIVPPDHLFSWVNVDEHLARLAAAGQWPDWLVATDSWWDCLELVTSTKVDTETVKRWLDQAFGTGSAGWVEGDLLLGLDDPRSTEFTGLRVELTVDADQRGAGRRRVPLLREKHITRELAEPLQRPEVPGYSGDVQLMAFHSFKGGVGRTVHAVAVADRLARSGGKVLLIDADLEAPGITWMHKEQGGQCDFTYEDFITLLQGGDNGDPAAAVDIAAAYLPNQQAGHYASGGTLTVMPSSRRATLTPPRIEPADLLSPGRSVYFVTEALAALGARLGVDTVVIDLRAGASELSAPVLLDPRVQRVFVTTLSHQSLVGTELMIRQLGGKAPTVQGVDPATSVIVTQYRMDTHTVQAEAARSALSAALGGALRVPEGGDGDETEPVDAALLARPVLSPFREELLALPSSWDAVLEVISSCGVADGLESLLPSPVPRSATEPEPGAMEVEYGQLRRNLARTAENLVYAEQSGLSSAGGFLVTEPLRRLLADHRTELPQALVVGAKGSGKTFMYAKACAARTWQTFAGQSGIRGVTVEAPIVPVLESANLEYGDFEPQDLRDDFASKYGDVPRRNLTASSIPDRLKAGLGRLDGLDELGWRSLWLECLAVACGLEPSEQRTSEEALIDLGRQAKAVFVVDGLEDLLQNLDNDTKRTALRVLLIDVLGWLRSLRGRPFGLVVFVRRDLVTGAVRQNNAQLLGRYAHYALHWSKVEALRLALWVASHAEALPEPVSPSGITDLSEEDLINGLIQLWGWKMGSAKSREARSHMWVPAALGDFKGQVQARDVVMFLATAAKNSEQYNDTVDDRVLVPTAMRKALLECSSNKITAVGEEDKEIGRLLTHMQGLSHSILVPFELEQVELAVAEADLLIEFGVFSKGADGRYWVPEIYRHGLGFNSEGRARVLW